MVNKDVYIYSIYLKILRQAADPQNSADLRSKAEGSAVGTSLLHVVIGIQTTELCRIQWSRRTWHYYIQCCKN